MPSTCRTGSVAPEGKSAPPLAKELTAAKEEYSQPVGGRRNIHDDLHFSPPSFSFSLLSTKELSLLRQVFRYETWGFFFFLSLFPSTARSSQLLALPTGHRPIGRLLVGTLYYISCSFHLVLENLHPPISFSTLFLLDTFSEDELDYLKPPFAHLKSVLSRSQFRKQPTREEVRFSSKSCVLGACRHPVSYCSWRFLLVCFTFL